MRYIIVILYTAEVDYAMSTELVFNVTISTGSTLSSISVDIINDMIQEDNETFSIAIRLLPSCLSLSLGTSSSTVTIIDNDGTNNNMYISDIIIAIIIIVAMLSFESSTFSGSESSGVISVTVIISGGITSSSDISVPITFTKENATGANINFKLLHEQDMYFQCYHQNACLDSKIDETQGHTCMYSMTLQATIILKLMPIAVYYYNLTNQSHAGVTYLSLDHSIV